MLKSRFRKFFQFLLGLLIGFWSHKSFAEAEVHAYLYNPTVDSIELRYPVQAQPGIISLTPTLTITGKNLSDGKFTLNYHLEKTGKSILDGTEAIQIENGWFEKGLELQHKYPDSQGVSWIISTPTAETAKGFAPLTWSRFHGQIKYLDGKWRSTFIQLTPVNWGAPGDLYIPVAEDGKFDAHVPARVYAALDVNGSGYAYDSLVRWGWDYDLTHDREEVFTVGRMELYGMRAFDILGGGSALFILFRPTSLSRVLQWDINSNGVLEEEELQKMNRAMKESPNVINPVLKAEDINVWLDGKPQKIVQFNRINEYSGDVTQSQYLMQIFPERKAARGVWHDIKIEVRSKEQLHDKEVVDFGQASVGFFRP